jgi:hypothetical protein
VLRFNRAPGAAGLTGTARGATTPTIKRSRRRQAIMPTSKPVTPTSKPTTPTIKRSGGRPSGHTGPWMISERRVH